MLGQNIIRAIKENFKSQRKTDQTFQFDNPLRSKGSKSKIDNPRSIIKWNFSPNGWIKGNFDGAAKGNLGRAGCGGVLRDHTDNIIDVIAIPIGNSNSRIT